MRFQKRVFTWVFIFILLIFGYLYVVLNLINPVLKENTNTLAIGQRAIVESLSVSITPPTDINYKSQEEIFKLRQDAAMQYPWLLYTSYEPSFEVFSGIQDKKPWWGVQGYFYYGKGEQSVLGPAEEGRFILNPYLLVGLEFSGVSIRSGLPETFWNKELITTAALSSGKFPFFVAPQNLQWWPKRSRVDVTYDLSEYLIRLNNWTARNLTYQDASFDLKAYNARDFNLNYLYVDYSNSIYITKAKKPPVALAIKHYLHDEDSCGYSGGCNNMSPETPEFEGLQVEKLPAKVIIYLWKDKPSEVTDAPDLTYVINIK